MTLTFAICTAGRDSLVHAISSLGRQTRAPDKLLIVDQSGSGKARAAMNAAQYPHAWEVIDQDAKGLSRARNLVLERLDTDWLFFTDDDCVVSLDLVEQFHKVIGRYPEAAFVTGTCIRPLDYDPITEDVPGVLVCDQCELNVETAFNDQPFMGACLALRKDLIAKTGKFDDLLGAGTEWPSGEELDYVFRAIELGFTGRANARLVMFHEYGARKRPADDTENGRIGNAVVLWKMRKMRSRAGVRLANRIYPAGPKKVLLSRLTFGRLFPIDLRMKGKCKVLEARLDRDYDVIDGVLAKKTP